MPGKFLIIRFSAIGDVVLTSPVIRSLFNSIPGAEIHFLTKKANQDILRHNPYISHVHILKDNFGATIRELKDQNFDHILDLHNNLRSARVKLALRCPSSSFPKRNLDKWLMCQPPLRSLASPIEHIVVRYGQTLESLGVPLDGGGLDVFLSEEIETWARNYYREKFSHKPQLAVVLGGTHTTKRWLTEYFAPTINKAGKPTVLIGGPDMVVEAKAIVKDLDVPYLNAVGEYGILESAALMKQCTQVLSHDTGFMHIAAAFGQKVVSIWGNTVPEFGMYPYKAPSIVVEEQLSCRPCSKIGYGACPKGHFACMTEIKPEKVVEFL